MHLLKRDDLSAHLEVNKCLNISPLLQTIFALLFEHYIEWISKIADCKKILYRWHTFGGILCRMLLIWNRQCATRSCLFQWVDFWNSSQKMKKNPEYFILLKRKETFLKMSGKLSGSHSWLSASASVSAKLSKNWAQAALKFSFWAMSASAS